MIRSIVFPRVVGKSLDDLQPVLALLQALGFTGGNEWHEGGSQGVEMLAPRGGFELIAAPDTPSVDAMVEVADADLAYQIVKSVTPTLSQTMGKDGAPKVVKSVTPTLSQTMGKDGAPKVVQSLAPTPSQTMGKDGAPSVVQSLTPTPSQTMGKEGAPSVVQSLAPTLSQTMGKDGAPKVVQSLAPTPSQTMGKDGAPSVVQSLTPTPSQTMGKDGAPSVVQSLTPTLSQTTGKDGAPSVVQSLTPTLSQTMGKDGAPSVVQSLTPTLSQTMGKDGAPKDSGLSIRKEIGDTSYGARLFEIEVSGLRLGFITYAKKADARGIEGALDAKGKRFAIVIARFNSFITERLLDGALLALRQCGADPKDIAMVHVPGSFEIPGAARQLAETKGYNAIVCLGCLLRGDTLHYEVIANEVTRGVGQSAQETGVPHGFGVLTCETLEQAIDRAGLKSGNKGYEAALAAVEMACLREKVSLRGTTAVKAAQ